MNESISIELSEDMTVGMLRELAEASEEAGH